MRPMRKRKHKRNEPKRMLGVTRMDIMRMDNSPRRKNWVRRVWRHLADNREHPFDRWLTGLEWPVLPFRKRLMVIAS